MPLFTDTITNIFRLQCPLEMATLDIAAALSIATSTPVTEASRYIQCALYCASLQFQLRRTQGDVSIASGSGKKHFETALL